MPSQWRQSTKGTYVPSDMLKTSQTKPTKQHSTNLFHENEIIFYLRAFRATNLLTHELQKHDNKSFNNRKLQLPTMIIKH